MTITFLYLSDRVEIDIVLHGAIGKGRGERGEGREREREKTYHRSLNSLVDNIEAPIIHWLTVGKETSRQSSGDTRETLSTGRERISN